MVAIVKLNRQLNSKSQLTSNQNQDWFNKINEIWFFLLKFAAYVRYDGNSSRCFD